MINSIDSLFQTSIEVFLPITNKCLQFIDVKDFDGQALRLDLPTFKELLINHMKISYIEELGKNKKAMKRISDIEQDLQKRTSNGIVFVMLEDIKGGVVYIGQKGTTNELADLKFDAQGWNKLKEIYIFSKKNGQFPLSLRTAIEAKLLKTAKSSKKYVLLNNKEETDEKIRFAEYQLKDYEVELFYSKVKAIFSCFGFELLI